MTNREYLIKLLVTHEDEELSMRYLTCFACSQGEELCNNCECEKGTKKWLDSEMEEEE